MARLTQTQTIDSDITLRGIHKYTQIRTHGNKTASRCTHTLDTHRHTPEETYMDTEDRHKEIKTHRDTIRNTQRGSKFTHTTNTDTCKSNTPLDAESY